MITIEKLTEADLPQLAVLYRELTSEPSDLAVMTATFHLMETNPDYTVLVAKSDGAVIGSLMGITCRELLGECQTFMVIENVVVSPGHRRMGIGRLLMAEIERLACELNCSLIQFCSGMQRQAAHRFYESMGYGPDVVRGFRKWLQ
jgi:GNAT superfamily N-acetyltransferase